MNFQKYRRAAILLAAGFLGQEALGLPDALRGWLPAEAAAVVALASSNHPAVVSALFEMSAAKEDRLSLDSFYEPSLSIAGGASKGPVSAPNSGFSPYLPDDALGLQGGVTVPLRAGAYVGAGAAQRRLDGALGDGSSPWQTLAGVRLSVPLLADRGFAQQRAREEGAAETERQRLEEWRAAWAVAARDAAAAYAYELYAGALAEQYRKALARVETLLNETSERVKLETMAQYQVFPAQMEVQFKRDDVSQYAALYTNAHHSLELAAGGVKLPFAPAGLLDLWATACATAEVARIVAIHGGERPEIAAARRAVEASRAAERELAEKLRSNLSLSAGVGYQGEHSGFGVGDENLLRDDRAGADVALVWSRPFSFDGEEAALRARRSRTISLLATLRRIENEAATERRRAEERFRSAVGRREAADKAVAFAAKALEAESERLGLGEGRSRNVLDAQSDLTSAEGRSNLAAYDVVLSFLDLMLANGVTIGEAAGLK